MRKLVAKKTANALCGGAEVRPAFRWLMGLTFDWTLSRMKKQNDGRIWVGGTLSVFDDRVQFQPNELNRTLQTGNLSFDLAWAEVTMVKWRWGVLSGIIELSHAAGFEAVRSFGSRRLADQMRELQEANTR